jgi:cell division protein FtsQ
MKKINFKKILNVTVWVLAVSGLITALGFVGQEEKKIVGKSISVNVDNTEGDEFVDREDIMDFLRSRHDTVKGQRISEIDVNILEKALLTHPSIAGAEVSISIDGQMKIDVKQRKPVVRIFSKDGESYYIDDKARLMLLSDNYTARVLVATGNIYEPYVSRAPYNVEELGNNKFLQDITLLDDIYRMATYIQRDSILNSLIQQININEKKEIELYPAIGDHVIVFGNTEQMQKKFEKLKVFYKEGLNNMDGWNKYSVINLKFEGQIVCTKKSTPAVTTAAD